MGNVKLAILSWNLKICREKVDPEIKEELPLLIDQLDTLIREWQGELPDLGNFFRREDIDWLLTQAAKKVISFSQGEQGKRIIGFVARSGYKDESDLDKYVKPIFRRTTALHHFAPQCMVYPFIHNATISDLFQIYDRFDVNYTDESGYTHFHVACLYDFFDIVKKFLELGQDLNLLWKKTGESPLRLALFNRSSSRTAELLMRNGANLNWDNKVGTTPLHDICAMFDDPYDLMEMFFNMKDELNQPVKVDARDKRGNTPLHGVAGKYKNVTEYLLRRGANPKLANDEGWTPLHFISQSDEEDDFAEMFFEINDELRQELQVDVRNEKGQTPLQLALLSGNRKTVEILLRRGADPNLADIKGFTPLHYISQRYREDDLVEIFFNINDELDQQVRVNVWDKIGRIPLQLAVIRGRKEQTETLLRRGADPNLANKDGLTPLHSICKIYWDEDLAKMFFDVTDKLNQVIQVDAKDKWGRTPLQLAVTNLMTNTVDVLLDRGANLSSFVFPNESNSDEGFRLTKGRYENKLKLTSRLMAVIQRLEKRGYELDRSDALIVMKLFSKYELFGKSTNLAKCWYDDEEFATETKKTMVNSSLSLYDLIQLRPEEATKLLTYEDYYKFSRIFNLWNFTEIHCEVYRMHLSEKMSRGFFWRWAMDPFMELINYRLPHLPCEMIMDYLDNEDLYHICVAASRQSCTLIEIYELRHEIRCVWLKKYRIS